MKGQTDILFVSSFGGHKVQIDLIRDFLYESSFKEISTIKSENKNIYCVSDCNMRTPLKLVKSFIQSFYLLVKINPKIIISTGAAPGALAIIAGRILGKKTIWIDSLANYKRLSLSCRITRFITTYCFTQWEHLEEKNVQYIGGLV